MTIQSVLQQLEQHGTEQNRKIYRNHGCDIEMYGVSVANLKQVLKPIRNNTELGKQLFLSNNMDAIYLSQWIVDPHQLTIEDIENQILLSHYYMLIEVAIPAVVAKDLELSRHCLSRWLDHEETRFRQAAYSLYSHLVSLYPDDVFDLVELSQLLRAIPAAIHTEENRVRYAMNQFVIAVGAYVKELHDVAMDTAEEVGRVEVFMGRTSCKVPFAPDYLSNIKRKHRIGTKRKR